MPLQPIRHPAIGVLRVRGITIRQVAARAGVSTHYTSRALNGYVRPSPKLRAAVCGLLPEMSADQLFIPEIEADQ